MRAEKRIREEHATHISSQRWLPALGAVALAARIITDRPYGFIMRHAHKPRRTRTRWALFERARTCTRAQIRAGAGRRGVWRVARSDGWD